MRFAFASSIIAAVASAKLHRNPMLSLVQSEDICRRTPPNLSFEWDDHDVTDWWNEIVQEYADSDQRFYALFDQWQHDKNAIIDRYFHVWEGFIVREQALDMQMMDDICAYVANNVYVNGIRLGNIIPELEQYMSDNYDPWADNIISMFSLDSLPMLQDTLPEIPMDFDLTIHPEEIQEIMQIRLDQYSEATEMLEAYKQQFRDAVDLAWDNYVANTMETVTMETDLHREVVEDTINYLWDSSAFPGPSLDDVYPRPSVAFAARNKRQTQRNSTNSGYYTGAAAATLAISSIAAYKYGNLNQSVKASPETLL